MAEQDQLLAVLNDVQGRKMMLIQLLLCRAEHRDWEPKQIEQLLRTLDSISDAFGISTEKMLHRIGDLQSEVTANDKTTAEMG